MGLLQVAAINAAMSSLIKTITVRTALIAFLVLYTNAEPQPNVHRSSLRSGSS